MLWGDRGELHGGQLWPGLDRVGQPFKGTSGTLRVPADGKEGDRVGGRNHGGRVDLGGGEAAGDLLLDVPAERVGPGGCERGQSQVGEAQGQLQDVGDPESDCRAEAFVGGKACELQAAQNEQRVGELPGMNQEPLIREVMAYTGTQVAGVAAREDSASRSCIRNGLHQAGQVFSAGGRADATRSAQYAGEHQQQVVLEALAVGRGERGLQQHNE
ncbi:hypothetical protein [Streptomyces sp. NPDC086766]|uniref:hypothetical protein n=1 Tax=Streptomyces sp. NPDC086766 TaxID=3365754 RepID=UPI003827BC69